MEITLAVIRCPDGVVPETRRSSGPDILLGRETGCDWTMLDPQRHLSKRHCAVEFRAGFWQLRDLSTNGTFLNAAAAPVGRDRVAPLKDGDRLRLGDYEIEVRIGPAAWAGAGHGAGRPGVPAGIPGLGPLSAGPGPGVPDRQPLHHDPFAANPFGTDPFGDDPLGPAPFPQPGQPPGLAPNPLPGTAPPGAFPTNGPAFGGLLPALSPGDAGLAPFPPASDHAPAMHDAFVPPRAMAGSSALPDDWDADPDPFGIAPPGPLPEPAAPLAAPVPTAGPAPSAAMPGAPLPQAGALPFPAALPTPVASDAEGQRLLFAFLEAAGVPARLVANQADLEVALRTLGAAFGAAIAGMQAMLAARGQVKRTFRIEQTMYSPAGNNPVKFAASAAAAIQQLLASGPDGARNAIRNAADDLATHQLATITATQAASRALLDRLSPDRLDAQQDARAGAMALLPGQRQARLWEAYRRLHAELAASFDDDFDSAFGKAFARAYERAAGTGGRHES